MKLKKIVAIETPYDGVTEEDYQIEKRRLQREILRILKRLLAEDIGLAVVLEGRDAAG